MAWKLLEYERPTRADLRPVLGEARFYADQNLDDSIFQVLRYKKHDVLTAREMGAENQPDGYHYKWAHKAHRILLTQDKDFLNNDLYPLALTRGVIIFNVDSSSTAELARAVEVVDVILSGIAPVLRQTKTIVNSDYTLTIIGREATNSGFAEKKTRYRLYRNGRDV